MNFFLLFLVLCIIGIESIENECVGKAQCCRVYEVGTLLENKYKDKLKNCLYDHQYCITTYCFKDDRGDRYLTYYSCDSTDNGTLCAEHVALWLSIEFCEDKTGSTQEECRGSRNKDPKSFERKYGGYKCNGCTISGKYAGNKDFLVDLPAAKATTKDSKNGGQQKLDIFVPYNISGIGNDCADFVHSSFIGVIGIAFLAIIETSFCGHLLT
ncbi:hypothetical protein niasHS_008742 [Heterodera schachtii]|uniref:Uncharacterized protein n=1 Tax=Heterodera schachtii TaxID=97005 RepID=A0ABD2IWS4_HETSC